MKKLILSLLALALASAQAQTIVYTIRGTNGQPSERELELAAGEFLRVTGSNTIESVDLEGALVDTTVVRTGFTGTGNLDLSGYSPLLLPTDITLQFRRGTLAEVFGITLAEGEAGFTTDTQQLRIGDGSTAGGIVPNLHRMTYEFTGTTTNATPLVISGTNIPIAAGTAKSFSVESVGVVSSGSAATIAAKYLQRGLVLNNSGTTALVTTVTGEEWESDTALDSAVIADNANDCLAVSVTGKAATTVVWRTLVEVY